MSDKVNIDEIENEEQLKEAFSILVQQYKETIKASGPLAKKAIIMGYKNQVNKINEKYDQIMDSIKSTKSNVKDTIKDAKEDIKKSIEDAKRDIEKSATEKRNDIKDLDNQSVTNEMGVAHDVATKNSEARNWQNAHQDRNSVVTGVVDKIQKKSIEVKAKKANRAIKLSTLAAKGARLFGAKGLAKELSERGSNYAQALFTKDSKIVELAKHMAESGFLTADQLKSLVEQAKYAAVGLGMDVVQSAKDFGNFTVEKGRLAKGKAKDFGETVVTSAFVYGDDAIKAGKNAVKKTVENAKDLGDTVVTSAFVYGDDAVKKTKEFGEKALKVTKKGALEVGKAAVIPAAAIGALGSISLDAAKLGIDYVGDKVNDARDTAGKYTELARAKTTNVRDNIKVGFLGKVSQFLENVKGKVDNSLETSRDSQEQSNERLVAAKSKVDAQREAQSNDAQDLDDGER